jgi:para-aminobenzoate synthetase component I
MTINLENTAIKSTWQRILAWANQFDKCCCLDGNHYDKNNGFRKIIAAGVYEDVKPDLQTKSPNAYIFGYIAYDFKNLLENLTSANEDNINVPLFHFFVPLYQFELVGNVLTITIRNDRVGEEVWQEILDFTLPVFDNDAQTNRPKLQLTPRISKKKYLETIAKIKQDIVNGDYYEINFCQEFYTTHKINPLAAFFRLNELTQSPYACYYKYDNKYLVCASPERFIQKTGRQMVSNPIKGTAARSKNAAEDEALRTALHASEKDRAENVMIVDLVRNDFARCCEAGSVRVPELFGIYTFPQVHQMISTVTGTLRENVAFSDIVAATFPMGSMTGAPKIMAMQRIEAYEQTKRGWYSGTVGCITPEGDFDFNVVIRSIFYNAETDYLCTQVGGAIVYDSVAESEYAECLLKAKAVLEVLGAEISVSSWQ